MAMPAPPPTQLPVSLGCLLDALPCGAAVVDRAGVLVHVNQRLAQMLGLAPAQLLGRSLIDLYDDELSRQRVQRVLGQFEEPAEGEFQLIRADGSPLPVVFAGRPLRTDADDQPARYRVATVIDISEQKRAYEDVAQLGDTVIEQAMQLKQLNETLEQRVQERTAELHTANMEAIMMLAVASEARDEDTGAHVQRIESAARRLAHAAGRPDDEAQRIGYSAILHDVGKIHIADGILKKPGPLTDDERRQMQHHTLIGERILSRQPFFDTARQIARSHHENWDGSGYPDRLSGEAIPFAARVVHLVDVYDALVSARPYKPAWPRKRALDELQRHRGRMFDPQLTDHFVALSSNGGVAD
jgi:PAS domain S-box-containing protein